MKWTKRSPPRRRGHLRRRSTLVPLAITLGVVACGITIGATNSGWAGIAILAVVCGIAVAINAQLKKDAEAATPDYEKTFICTACQHRFIPN